MSDYDEETRVTSVVQHPVGNEPTNDCLVVIYSQDQDLLGRRYVLDGGVLRVGRGQNNQIILQGDSVSRQHAHFERRSGNWWIVDDDSTNGTYLNEALVQRENKLTNSDRVKIGPTILKFLSGADAEAKYHEEIYRMTIIDGLTQIHNKRALNEALDREVTRARRHGRPLCLVMFDIDFFKRINDVYGHLAGDHVLRELATVCMTRIRKDEVFARYGGEEFSIVLPETPLEGAVSLASDIRGLVESHPFVFQGERIQVTVSLGCAQLDDGEETAMDLVRRADEKLYEAKRGGRNRVAW